MVNKSFIQYVQEQEIIETPTQPRKVLKDVIGFLSVLEPKDIAECTDQLLELQKIIDSILSGAR